VNSPHEQEAKRAAERTGIVAVTVIFGILTVALVVLLVTRLAKGSSIGVGLWIGIVALVAMLLALVRLWSRNIRSRRASSPERPGQ
jgi:hypothetical protein